MVRAFVDNTAVFMAVLRLSQAILVLQAGEVSPMRDRAGAVARVLRMRRSFPG